MRYNNTAAILTPGEPGKVAGLLSQPGDDFLSRVNTTISNFKELMKMAKELQGLTGSQDKENEPLAASPLSPPGQPGLAQFVQLLIQNGYGDTPLGELFDKVKPYSIKQVLEVINRAGPKW